MGTHVGGGGVTIGGGITIDVVVPIGGGGVYEGWPGGYIGGGGAGGVY